MGVASALVLLLTHPTEFRTLANFWLWHEGKRDITAKREHATSGWDRASMRRCWDFLDMTSRSFSAVIKELEGDLARTVCLFYLVLRGLDTIEDDMTLPDDVKQPLMARFHEHCVEPGWKFNGSGPDEKDRQLLVEYDVVVTELNLLEPAYRAIILDITQKMAFGMAKYAHKAALAASGKAAENELFVETVRDYDVYCHYVAGLVGEGLSRLLAASGKEGAFLADQLSLSNSMGLLLQKTNILRDYAEDAAERRFFWPRALWAPHGFTHLEQLRDPARRQDALWALSAMTLDALRHAPECLDYLSLLRNQSVFNFCAIPQTMAMATLALCFMNPAVLERNVKIRKAAAIELILASTNPRDVAYLFRDYARRIHAKATPADPHYVKIAVACSKIEVWAETHFPSFITLKTSSAPGGGSTTTTHTLNASDARIRIVQAGDARKREKREAELADALAAHDALAAQREQEKKAGVQRELVRPDEAPPLWLFGGVIAFVLLLAGISAGATYLMVRYDVFASWDRRGGVGKVEL